MSSSKFLRAWKAYADLIRIGTAGALIAAIMLTIVTVVSVNAADHNGVWAMQGSIPVTQTYSNVTQIASVPTNYLAIGRIWIEGSGSVEVSVKADSWGATLATIQCKATSTWTACRTPAFNTGSHSKVTFIIQNSYAGTGTVRIDDTFVGYNSENHLVNPGFEQGSAGWNISSAAVWSIVSSAAPANTVHPPTNSPRPSITTSKTSMTSPRSAIGVTPPTCSTIRVDAGSTSNHTDSKGNLWLADQNYLGGSRVNLDSISNAKTSDPMIYLTEHYGMSAYSFNVTNCAYRVILHFAETIYTSAGQRTFNVNLNGVSVLNNFDVFADAGGANTADDKAFNTTVDNGSLTLTFTAVVDTAEINGIEIIPASSVLPVNTIQQSAKSAFTK